MKTASDDRAVVLAISGHDPGGGAGVQADIEAITGLGAHAVTLVSATTAQNTATLEAVYPQPVAQIRRAAELLLADTSVSAVKIGLLGSLGTVKCVAAIIRRIPGVPVVLDPVTHAGSGDWSLPAEVTRAIAELLVPLATIVTPNTREARELAGEVDAVKAADRLLHAGARYVLITGTEESEHKRSEIVVNRLFRRQGEPLEFPCRRLPFRYHGSGCTLSAAIAANLALGLVPENAVKSALEYTWSTLERGVSIGRAQKQPDRRGGVAGTGERTCRGA